MSANDPIPDVGQPPIYSMVPDAEPIELVAYYPRFGGYYPEAELQTKRWITRNAQPDWVAVDVGANVGVYSLLLSRLLTGGEAHAFEPTETARLLRRDLVAKSASNVIVHDLALGSRTGTVEEPLYRIWGAEPEIAEYRFSTLDDFVQQAGVTRVDIVKIDVDGFDFEVLKGAERTLRRFDPWVVIELNHALATRGQSPGEAMLWLLAQGYTQALVLDKENFVLERSATPAQNSHGSLSLLFDCEPILLPTNFVAGEPLPDLFGAEPALHNRAELLDETIVVRGPRWAYSASWKAQRPPPSEPMMVAVDLEVSAGAVGLSCLTADQSTIIGTEEMLSAAPGPQSVRLFVPDGADVGHVMLRNTEEDGRPGRAKVLAIHVARAKRAGVATSVVLRCDVSSFDLDAPHPGSPSPSIRIVDVQNLGEVLGSRTPCVAEPLLHRYGLEHFKTEIDEPNIYRYLYRQLAPRRHLELGTWEGFGVVLCAESCAAEIWTVNLPEGEADAAGRALYGAQRLPGDPAPETTGAGDAGERIGWRYRAAGYGSRVHQLLCDSRELPLSDFAPGFFDTILIDGGHFADVVTDDTDKVLHLLRSGGVMIWHDFCPDPTVLATQAAVRGVTAAWMANHERWRRN